MSEELRKFMYKHSLDCFDKLKEHQGEKITVLHNKVIDTKLPPTPAVATGILQEVKPFDCVVFSTGGSIPFVDNNNIIRQIFLNETKEMLYDKTLVVNKDMKVNNNLSKVRIAIFGIDQPKKQTKSMINEQGQLRRSFDI